MQQVTGVRLLFLSLSISIVAFLVSLDGFIVNVAIPTISSELGVRRDIGTWMITLFTMASTLFVPLSGWLAKRWGKVFVFWVSTLLFAFSSLLCGYAKTFQMLLLFRVFQGATAGLLTPLSFSLIIESFPVSKRSIAVGFWSFFVMVGPAMGPMVGGWLSNYHWGWMFHINIPFALFSSLVVYLIIGRDKEETEQFKFDWIGLFFLYLGMGCLQVALNRGNVDDWFRSPFINTLLIIGFVSLCFYIPWELFHPNPFIDLKIFKRRNFTIGAISLGLSMAMLFSSFILDSLWVQDDLGYTPEWAGYSLTPVGIFPLLIYPVMGRFVSYLDSRIWVGLSFLLYACTFFWLTRINVDIAFWQIATPRLVQGIGFAMLTVPIALIAVEGVAADKMTFVVSLYSFVRMSCVALLAPLAVNQWNFRELFYQSRIVDKSVPISPVYQQFIYPIETLDITQKQVQAIATDLVRQQAATLGLADLYYLYGWLFLILFTTVFFYKVQRKKQIAETQ